MQGLEEFVPTELKIQYINSLLKVGFDVIDFGSFVSPKSTPQMRDTIDVLKKLDLENSVSALLAVVPNVRGAEDACVFPDIDFLGYPFSISEEFQLRNTNATREQSISRVDEINNLCIQNFKELVVHLSMAFGNPYDEEWNMDIIFHWIERLTDVGVKTIALSDTIGSSTPESIKLVCDNLTREFPFLEFSAHLHSTPEYSLEKIKAAYKSGCRAFDSAILGFGGCPFAQDELTGNISTEILLEYLKSEGEELELDFKQLQLSHKIARRIFSHHL
jgi:hydroxymethylglutaryl-CoA lyase